MMGPHEGPRRARLFLRIALAVCAAAVVLVVIPAAVAGVRIWRSASGLSGGVDAVRADLASGDLASARHRLEEVRSRSDAVARAASSPTLAIVRLTPVVGDQFRAAAAIGRVGERLAGIGLAAVDAADSFDEVFSEGRLDADASRALAATLREALDASGDARDAADDIPMSWLAGPLDDARRVAVEQTPGAVDALTNAVAVFDGLPGLLAEGGTKRYLLAFSDLAELRGSGGHIGFVAVLRVTDGAMQLEGEPIPPAATLPRPGDVPITYPDWFSADQRANAAIWQNINMSPDFPTVADLMLQAASAEMGALDGVMLVDAHAVAAVLSLFGPVDVDAWPEPVTAGTVADIAYDGVHERYPDEADRRALLAQLVSATFARVSSGSPAPGRLPSFGDVVSGGHLMVWTRDAEDRGWLDDVGLTGSVDRLLGDEGIGAYVVNASATKFDWYLDRAVERVEADGRVSVTMRIQARGGSRPVPAERAAIVTVLVRDATRVVSISIDGRPAGHQGAVEAGVDAWRVPVTIPDEGSVVVEATFERG